MRQRAKKTAVIPPVQAEPTYAALVPPPQADRYPTVLGSRVTLQYISSVFSLSLSGYRRELVDLLDELLERDPNLFCVLSQSIESIAGARWTVETPHIEEEDQSPKAKRSREIAEFVEEKLKAIPSIRTAFARLLWGDYYGISAEEIDWSFDGGEWSPRALLQVHSRRISFTNQRNWEPYLWDNGAYPNLQNIYEDSIGTGLRFADLPGKFVVYQSNVRGDYPTREGLGRQVAYWTAMKLMAARGAGEYIERFGKPWVFGKFSTRDDGNPRAATADDITKADLAIKAIGAGSLSAATLPDSIDVTLGGPAANTGAVHDIPHKQWIDVCDSQITRAVLGQTDTVEAGPNGSRSAVETRKEATNDIIKARAARLAEALMCGLVRPLVSLNYPGEEALTPHLVFRMEQEPTPDEVLDVAGKAADVGMAVDAEHTAKRAGVKTTTDPKKRLAKVKPVDMHQLITGDFEPPLPPNGAAPKPPPK